MKTLQPNKRFKTILYGVVLSLLAMLSGCVPGTEDDGYSYRSDLESLYNEVENILYNLAETGFDGKSISVSGAEEYTQLTADFAIQVEPLDVPIDVDGEESGNLQLQPRGGGQITSTFRSTANDQTTVSFDISDPDRPRFSDDGSLNQIRAYDNGLPIVQEIIRQLNDRFQQL